MKKIVKISLAWLLALAALFSLCACGRFVNDRKFDYVTSNLSRYVSSLEASDFVGKELALSGEYVFSTDADAEKEFLRLQLLYGDYKTETDLNGNEALKYFYTGNPSLGDAVYIYYEVAKTESGECFASNLYANSQPVDIGYSAFPEAWRTDSSKLFYLESISESVKAHTPVVRIMDRAVAKGDVVRISYQREWEDGTVDATRAIHLRYDTVHSDAIAGLKDALVGKMPGDTFDHTIPTKKGEVEMNVTYHVTVNWIAEEEYVVIPVEIPENYFEEKDGKALFETNGTTVYLRYFIENYLYAQAPAQNLQFYKNVIGGFTTEKTDAEPEALHAEAVEAMKKQLDADVWEEVKSEMLDLLMASLEARVVRIPLAEYNSYYDDVYAVELESFRAELADAENYGYTVPYSTVDEYIAAVTDGEFTSLSAFCTYYAEKQIANRILLFAMAEAIGERLNKEKNDELYRENIEYATKYYGWTEEEYLINYAAVNIDPALYQDASGKADRELAKRLAEKELRWRVSYSYHLDVVLAYVYENNTYVLPNE